MNEQEKILVECLYFPDDRLKVMQTIKAWGVSTKKVIAYEGNLDPETTPDYLRDLVGFGLLEQGESEKKEKVYNMTPKGEQIFELAKLHDDPRSKPQDLIFK